MAVVDLQDVASGRPTHPDGELHALLDHADLIGSHTHAPELRGDLQSALLRDCKGNKGQGTS